MLKRLFHYDNPIFRAINTIGEIIILNFMWMICSLPIVTIGASTTALMYSCMKLHYHEGYPWFNFLASFKENFKQSTGLFLLYAVAGAVLAADMVLGNQAKNSYGTFMKVTACVLAVPYFLSLLYVFGVQSRFVNKVKDTIRYSFFLAVRSWKATLQMALLIVVVVFANTTVALVNYITLMFGAGFIAYFLSAYYNRVFEPYMPKSEEELEEEQAQLEKKEEQ